MDFFLTPEQEAVREAAVRFAEKEITPRVAEQERTCFFPKATIQKMGELGFFGATFPEAWGGTNQGYLCHALLCEEISRAHSSLRTPFNLQAMTCPATILQWGSPAQKEKFVRKLVKAEWMGLFAITEPDAGARYLVEASSDLLNWTKRMAQTSAGGTVQFTDTSTTNSTNRFYRIVVP